MKLRAAVSAMGLLCAGVALPTNARAQAPARDEALARAYREIRAAEIAEDGGALERLARDAEIGRAHV